MPPEAPTSIVALLVGAFLSLVLYVLGARDPRRERLLLLAGLFAAGFGAAGVLDLALELGLYPVGALLTGGALAGGAAYALRGAAA